MMSWATRRVQELEVMYFRAGKLSGAICKGREERMGVGSRGGDPRREKGSGEGGPTGLPQTLPLLSRAFHTPTSSHVMSFQ